MKIISLWGEIFRIKITVTYTLLLNMTFYNWEIPDFFSFTAVTAENSRVPYALFLGFPKDV